MTDNLQTVLSDEAGEMASTEDDGSRTGLIATGGILGAIITSSCCILPLALTVAGVSGAWMANLRALAPYQPIFITLTIVVLSYGFYLVYWKPKMASADGAVCARPIVPLTVVKVALWLAAVIVVSSIIFPYWFPLIVPYLP